MDITAKIQSLNIDLDNLPSPGGSYSSVNVRGSIATVAIQFPIKDALFEYIGRIGAGVTTEEGYEAAKLCALNIIGQIQKHVGFEKVEGLNHLDIYYQCSDLWDEGPKVANGASDLFNTVLGDAGKHTRAIMGVHKLPRNSSVAIVSSFTLKRNN